MKKPINTKMHGILDYVAGTILILPWVVNYNSVDKDTWLLALVGAAIIVISMITDYELSLIKIIPMKLHLFIDVITGAFLIVLPFLFPLHNYFLYWPIVFGIGELIIVTLSSARPYKVTKNDLNITT